MRSVSVDAEPSADTVSAGFASCVTVSRAVGGLSATTATLAVAAVEALPPVSVAIRVTVYVPAAAYVCWAAVVGAVIVTAAVPSPKSTRQLAIGVRSESVEVDASARTVSAGVTSCETESRAFGGVSAITVMLVLAAVEALPPLSVAIRVTV